MEPRHTNHRHHRTADRLGLAGFAVAIVGLVATLALQDTHPDLAVRAGVISVVTMAVLLALSARAAAKGDSELRQRVDPSP